MRIGQKAHIENQVCIGGNAVAKSEAHHGNQQRPPSGILKAVDDELAQLVNVEFGGVNDHVRETPDGRHPPALLANSFGDGSVVPERMRAPRFAEAAHQRFVAGFDENKRRGMFAAQFAIDPGSFSICSPSRASTSNAARSISPAFDIEFAESGNQSDRQIINAIKAKVFEGIQDGAFAGAGKAGENNQLARVAISDLGALHGRRRC